MRCRVFRRADARLLDGPVKPGHDKWGGDKARWHRRMRARERLALAHSKEMPDIKEVSNPWYMGKDGRCRVEPRSKLTRK